MSVNQETFFNDFAAFADASNGVQKLRELILQLAVQGKLVPQDPNDEPASVLLAKIKAEKERLIQEKKIKKSEPLPPIEVDKVPFNLPQGWEWARFGTITINRDGERIPLEKSARAVRHGQYDYYGASGVIDKIDDFLFDKPLLLIGEDGANLVNRSTPIAFIAHGKYWVNNHAHVLDGISLSFLRYVELFINSIDLKPYVTGTAQPKMNQAKMNSIVVAVPPHNEQQRILAKVDQLMALCGELEARQQRKQSVRVKLNNAALEGLLTARAPAEFAEHWQRICDNFDLLYDAPETVASLRQAILQLAVQGKLVPQDANDEPASVLLAKIKAEKCCLIQEKKVKKSEPLQPPNVEALPYELPDGWKWIWLDDISDIGTGTTPSTANRDYYLNGDVPWVTSSITSQEHIVAAEQSITKLAVADCRLRLYPPGTLIIALYGQGKTRGQVSHLKISATINQACAAIVFFETGKEIRDYIHLVLKKKYEELREMAAGGAQPNLNVGKIKETLIPLPPLAEQRRIVAKVDQLMALCDELEAKLRQAQAHSAKLMTATVQHLAAG